MTIDTMKCAIDLFGLGLVFVSGMFIYGLYTIHYPEYDEECAQRVLDAQEEFCPCMEKFRTGIHEYRYHKLTQGGYEAEGFHAEIYCANEGSSDELCMNSYHWDECKPCKECDVCEDDEPSVTWKIHYRTLPDGSKHGYMSTPDTGSDSEVSIYGPKSIEWIERCQTMEVADK